MYILDKIKSKTIQTSKMAPGGGFCPQFASKATEHTFQAVGCPSLNPFQSVWKLKFSFRNCCLYLKTRPDTLPNRHNLGNFLKLKLVFTQSRSGMQLDTAPQLSAMIWGAFPDFPYPFCVILELLLRTVQAIVLKLRKLLRLCSKRHRRVCRWGASSLLVPSLRKS